MKTKTFLQIIITSIACATVAPMFGMTVPAGTTLIVRTLNTISSLDTPGTRLFTELDKDIIVNGKVALSAGTKVSGRVETSNRTLLSEERLTVSITDVDVRGRTVSVKTTGAVGLENPFARKTPRGVSISTRSYQIPRGTKIQFRLAQPLDIS